MSEVESVVVEIAGALLPGSIVVIKSTVPPGTAGKMAALFGRADVTVASNPEFLREGNAVADFLGPDRIVVGADTRETAELVAGLYAKLAAPVVFTSTASAELAKYAANCFLAVKLSYINGVAELCERSGADIAEVTSVLSYDRRIGASHLQPGPGWGGPCLPKDTHALLHASATLGAEFDLLRAALATNERQHHRIVSKIRQAAGGDLKGRKVGLLGLTFKAGTGDLRNSPSLAVAALLAAEHARLTGYDPAIHGNITEITVAEDPYQAVTGTDVVVLLTDWPQFQLLDWTRVSELMAGKTIIDARNCLDSTALNRAGLSYHGIGKFYSRLEQR
jgi:UDPglucose 6-dehydrogenase